MDHFVEDVGIIRVSNGMVYVECVRRTPGRDAGAAPTLEACGNLVMPIGSFVRMFGSFSQAVERMIELKILQRRVQGAPEVANPSIDARIDDQAPKESKTSKRKS